MIITCKRVLELQKSAHAKPTGAAQGFPSLVPGDTPARAIPSLTRGDRAQAHCSRPRQAPPPPRHTRAGALLCACPLAEKSAERRRRGRKTEGREGTPGRQGALWEGGGSVPGGREVHQRRRQR